MTAGAVVFTHWKKNIFFGAWRMEILKIKLSELTPDPDNAKEHPEGQIDQIMESIRRWGFNDPIGVWGDENVTADMRRCGVSDIKKSSASGWIS